MLHLTVAPGNQFTEGYGNEFTIIVTNLDRWPGTKYVLGNKILSFTIWFETTNLRG